MLNIARLLGVLAVVLAVLVPSTLASCAEGGKAVSVEEAKKMVDKGGIVIIDVRTPNEFNAGHINGAKNINIYDPNFATEIKKLNKKSTVLVYCHMGSRSVSAQKIMVDAGFSKVYDLKGGMLAWRGKNYPVKN